MSNGMVADGAKLDRSFEDMAGRIDTIWKKAVVGLGDAFLYLADSMTALNKQGNLAHLTDELDQVNKASGDVWDRINRLQNMSPADYDRASSQGGKSARAVVPRDDAVDAAKQQLDQLETQRRRPGRRTSSMWSQRRAGRAAARMLFEAVETETRQRMGPGCGLMLANSKVGSPDHAGLDALLVARGYAPMDLYYAKWLG